MKRYKAPADIVDFFVGGNYYRVVGGEIEVDDGVNIDSFIFPLGFVEIIGAPDPVVSADVKKSSKAERVA